MKFICPESQKRVSLKCGNIVSTTSSAGGSVSLVAFAWGAVSTFAVAGASGCCANDGSAAAKAAQNKSISQRAPLFTSWACFLIFSHRDEWPGPSHFAELIPLAGFLSDN